MEPDFESTPEALVAHVELRSITSSQVLARPSEWLELLRRYGNVAPFFLGFVKGSRKTDSRKSAVAVVAPGRVLRSYMRVRKSAADRYGLAAVPKAMDARSGASAIQILTPSYFHPIPLRSPACLVFSGELQRCGFFRQ